MDTTRAPQSPIGTAANPALAPPPLPGHVPYHEKMDLLSLELPGIPKVRRGKVREVFDLGPAGLLLVSTDRISAFDCVLPDAIPHKGAVLNGLSAFWFGHVRARAGVADHLLTADFAEFPPALQPYAAQLAGRAMLVRRARPLPVECVVRGCLAGSGWNEYQHTGALGGTPLPAGLRLAEPLPEPMFTPTSKAESGHDQPLRWEEFVQRLGNERLAEQLRHTSLLLYLIGASHAADCGIVLADTKFEFGRDEATGELLLIDECLTPDSSRFWPAAEVRPGTPPPSYDKQGVRDYLETLGWDKTPPAPSLPPEIIARTSAQYLQAYLALAGRPLPTYGRD